MKNCWAIFLSTTCTWSLRFDSMILCNDNGIHFEIIYVLLYFLCEINWVYTVFNISGTILVIEVQIFWNKISWTTLLFSLCKTKHSWGYGHFLCYLYCPELAKHSNWHRNENWIFILKGVKKVGSQFISDVVLSQWINLSCAKRIYWNFIFTWLQ